MEEEVAVGPEAGVRGVADRAMVATEGVETEAAWAGLVAAARKGHCRLRT